MSGPVAGLIGGIWAGKGAGHENVVTLDMGGTSADIGVAAGGQLRMRHLLDTKIGDYQAMVPMVDIDTIGAGGGSIAYVDEGGVFRVGPQSAGADPGPACYGRGGTDADLDRRAAPARTAPSRPRAPRRRRCSSTADLAERGDRSDVAERARDDRRGGGARCAPDPEVRHDAGDRAELRPSRLRPARVHARRRRRRRSAVRVRDRARARDPARAGAAAPRDHRRRRGCWRPTSSTSSSRPSATRSRASTRHACRARFDELVAQAVAQLDEDGVPDDRRLGPAAWPTAAMPARATRCASRCPPEPSTTPGSKRWGRLPRGTRAEYGHRFDAAIEIINIRAVGIGRVDELEPPTLEAGDGDPSGAKTLERDVVFDVDGSAERHLTPFYERELLRAGDRIVGPAVDRAVRLDHGRSRRDSTAEIDRLRQHRRSTARPASARRERRERDGLSTPILMRVIGGALRVDREGDGGRPLPHVLLVDHPRVRGPRRRDLRPRRQQPGRVGLDADVHGRDAEDRQERDQDPRRRHPRGRRDPPQRPVRRRDALARRRDRDPDLLRGRARRVLGRLGPPPRHRRRLPGPGDRPGRQLVGGKHLPGRQAPGEGRLAGRPLEAHPRERPHSELQQRRHPRDDRRLRARHGERYVELLGRYGEETVLERRQGLARLLRADAAPGDREGPGRALRDRARLARRRRRQPRREAAGEGRGRDRGRRDHLRPHGLERRGADRLQLPVRGHDRLGDDLHHADDLPRRGDLPGLRPPERGHAGSGERDRAEGLDLQPAATRAPASRASARSSGRSTSRCARSRR